MLEPVLERLASPVWPVAGMMSWSASIVSRSNAISRLITAFGALGSLGSGDGPRRMAAERHGLLDQPARVGEVGLPALASSAASPTCSKPVSDPAASVYASAERNCSGSAVAQPVERPVDVERILVSSSRHGQGLPAPRRPHADRGASPCGRGAAQRTFTVKLLEVLPTFTTTLYLPALSVLRPSFLSVLVVLPAFAFTLTEPSALRAPLLVTVIVTVAALRNVKATVTRREPPLTLAVLSTAGVGVALPPPPPPPPLGVGSGAGAAAQSIVSHSMKPSWEIVSTASTVAMSAPAPQLTASPSPSRAAIRN